MLGQEPPRLVRRKSRKPDAAGAQVIGRIRDELPDLLIATRFNAYDGIPYRAAETGAIGEPCPHRLPLVTAFGTDQRSSARGSRRTRSSLFAGCDPGRWACERVRGQPLFQSACRPSGRLSGRSTATTRRSTRCWACCGTFVAVRFRRPCRNIPVVGSGYSWLQEFAPHAGSSMWPTARSRWRGLAAGLWRDPTRAPPAERPV